MCVARNRPALGFHSLGGLPDEELQQPHVEVTSTGSCDATTSTATSPFIAVVIYLASPTSLNVLMMGTRLCLSPSSPPCAP